MQRMLLRNSTINNGRELVKSVDSARNSVRVSDTFPTHSDTFPTCSYTFLLTLNSKLVGFVQINSLTKKIEIGGEGDQKYKDNRISRRLSDYSMFQESMVQGPSNVPCVMCCVCSGLDGGTLIPLFR